MTLLHLLPFVAATVALAPRAASAQEFPEGAATPAGAALQQHLSGQVFDVKLANGREWRVEYRGNGYFFLDVIKGPQRNGKWRVEDGKLCHEFRLVRETCNDVRMKDAALHLKRDNSEIVKFVKR